MVEELETDYLVVGAGAMGHRLKRIAFVYLISYLAVAAVGFTLFPALTFELFLSNGDYGEILPRLLGAMMWVLSFLLFMIYRQGDWPKYSPFTMMARTPLVLFIFYLYYLCGDPMFLIINAIILVGLITTAVGTALERKSDPSVLVLALVVGIAVTGCSKSTTERLQLPPLEAVPQVEIERYLGTWYEIASYPQRFQKGCTGTTATYTLRSDGEIDVLNKCRKESLDGPEDVAEGRARVVDAESNAKLEVSFFGPFWGDYWIIDLGPDYEYAVVGHPSRDYLWILSRTPTLDDDTYGGILSRLEAMGYPLEPLQKTLQPTGS